MFFFSNFSTNDLNKLLDADDLINKTFDISFDESTASIMLLKPYISMFLLIFKKKGGFLYKTSF